MGVTGFLSPDQTQIEIRIYENQLTGTVREPGSAAAVVPDAEVTVTNRQTRVSLTLPFVVDSGFYVLPAPTDFLQAGQRYELRIDHPRLGQARAECVIPSSPEGFTLRLDSIPGQFQPLFYCYPSWRALPAGNLYRLVGKVFSPTSTPGELRPKFFLWEGTTAHPDYLQNPSPGQDTIQGPRGDLQTNPPQTPGYGPGPGPGAILQVDLLHVTDDYFRFQIDIREARLSDPLLSEPYLIHSNIEGAEGIFTAYNRVSKRLRIR